MAALSYCATQVRDFDNDRFLATLFADEAVREDLFALYAFNLELSKIRETVSEPMIGRMRLQFWRDAMPGIAVGNPPKHAVAAPLAVLAERGRLPAQAMTTLIDAREIDLDEIPPADLSAIEDYAAQTSSTLMAAALHILGHDPAEHDALLRSAGIATALVGLVRAIPFMASSGRVTLPADLCRKAGLDPAMPHQWPQNPDVSAITMPLLRAAADHLKAARTKSGTLPRSALPALLPMSLAAVYLRGLEKSGGDPARCQARPPGVQRHLTVLWRSVLGRP